MASLETVVRKARKMILSIIWWTMAISAFASLIMVGAFPFVKAAMMTYQEPEIGCTGRNCGPPPCVINGTVLGSDFRNVDVFYTLPVSAMCLLINFLLVVRMLGSRFMNLFFTTFAFFCIFVFPFRFLFLAMQTLEFTAVGGDYYTLLFARPYYYDCPFFSGNIDAVFLMHLRFLLLLIDFCTFHFLVISVPIFYFNDKISVAKYHAILNKHHEVHPADMFIVPQQEDV